MVLQAQLVHKEYKAQKVQQALPDLMVRMELKALLVKKVTQVIQAQLVQLEQKVLQELKAK